MNDPIISYSRAGEELHAFDGVYISPNDGLIYVWNLIKHSGQHELLGFSQENIPEGHAVSITQDGYIYKRILNYLILKN